GTERRFRLLLQQARSNGYATRDPRTKPYRTSTLAMPIREGPIVRAAMTISFFKTAIPMADLEERIVAPMRETAARIEEAFTLIEQSRRGAQALHPEKLEMGF